VEVEEEEVQNVEEEEEEEVQNVEEEEEEEVQHVEEEEEEEVQNVEEEEEEEVQNVEEEEEDVEEMEINGKQYFVTGTKDGSKVYKYITEDEVGDLVGYLSGEGSEIVAKKPAAASNK
jgi:hypothetical protein